jgi:hypothetical protein
VSVLGTFAIGAGLFARFVGRWVFVPEQAYRPAVDI